MKTATPELLALMKDNQTFTLADLYTITTAAGTALRYTDFDVDLETPSNMFTYSEQFDHSSWQKIRASVAYGVVQNHYGAMTATKVTEDTTSTSTHEVYRWTNKPAAADVYTFSIYVKPEGRKDVILQVGGLSGAARATINVETATVTGNYSSGQDYFISASAVAVGNGWCRCSITALSDSDSKIYTELYLHNGMTFSYSGDGLSGVYIFGAQLIRNRDAQSYIKTNESPVAGNTFSASGPILKRGKTRIVIGLEVDTLDVEIYPRPDDLVSGQTWLAAATAGVFDGATLKLERAFLSPTPTVAGALVMFSGIFADLETARARISARVNSDTAALQVQVPRNLYQASCLNVLYGADCRADRATYAAAGTVSGGSNTASILCSLAQAAGYFDTGYVVFTSGALAGTRRTVKAYIPGKFTLYNPLPSAPAVGAAFTVYPGCDKSLATCKDKFNNRANFRGFPFIPVPETSI